MKRTVKVKHVIVKEKNYWAVCGGWTFWTLIMLLLGIVTYGICRTFNLDSTTAAIIGTAAFCYGLFKGTELITVEAIERVEHVIK